MGAGPGSARRASRTSRPCCRATPARWPFPPARPVDLSREVLPWVKDDLALLGVPGPEERHPRGLHRRGRATRRRPNQFAASLSPGGRSKKAKIGRRHADASTRTGVATARSGGQALFGERRGGPCRARRQGGTAARARGLRPGRGPRPSCPTSVWPRSISPGRASSASLAGATGTPPSSTPSSTTARPPAWPLGARARDDGVEVNLVSDLDPKLEQRSPTVFASLPQFEPGLADEAGPQRARLHRGRRARAGAQQGAGDGGSERAGTGRLAQGAGAEPAASRRASIRSRTCCRRWAGRPRWSREPTDGGALRQPDRRRRGREEGGGRAGLAAAAAPARGRHRRGQVPSFQSREVDGVTVHSVQVSPTVDLSYAIFDGKLVISTQPEGIAQVRSSGDNLAGTGAYEARDGPAPGPGLGASLPQPR